MKKWIRELCPEIAEWQVEMIAEEARLQVWRATMRERESIAQMFEGGYEHILRDNVAHEIRARGEK